MWQYNYTDFSNNFIAHSGKKGMKWGYNDGKSNGGRTADQAVDEIFKITGMKKSVITYAQLMANKYGYNSDEYLDIAKTLAEGDSDQLQKITDTLKSVGQESNPDSDIVNRVIRGEFGNGEDRKKALAAAGYDYNSVQSQVNQVLTGKSTYSNKSTEKVGQSSAESILSKHGSKKLKDIKVKSKRAYKNIKRKRSKGERSKWD